MRWVMLMLLILVVTPVRVITDVWHSTLTDVQIGISLWSLRLNVRIRILRNQEGWQVLLVNRHGRIRPVHARPGQVQQGVSWMKTLLRSDRARRLLLRHIDLERLRIALRLGLSNAARTAVLTGAIQVLQQMLPVRMQRRVCIQARPDFVREETLAQARCIVFFHLGTLLITAAMALGAYWLERRKRAPQTVKEA